MRRACRCGLPAGSFPPRPFTSAPLPRRVRPSSSGCRAPPVTRLLRALRLCRPAGRARALPTCCRSSPCTAGGCCYRSHPARPHAGGAAQIRAGPRGGDLHRRAAGDVARGRHSHATRHAVAAHDAGLAGKLLWNTSLAYVSYGHNAKPSGGLITSRRFGKIAAYWHSPSWLLPAGSQVGIAISRSTGSRPPPVSRPPPTPRRRLSRGGGLACRSHSGWHSRAWARTPWRDNSACLILVHGDPSVACSRELPSAPVIETLRARCSVKRRAPRCGRKLRDAAGIAPLAQLALLALEEEDLGRTERRWPPRHRRRSSAAGFRTTRHRHSCSPCRPPSALTGDASTRPRWMPAGPPR